MNLFLTIALAVALGLLIAAAVLLTLYGAARRRRSIGEFVGRHRKTIATAVFVLIGLPAAAAAGGYFWNLYEERAARARLNECRDTQAYKDYAAMRSAWPLGRRPSTGDGAPTLPSNLVDPCKISRGE